jgi:hypothetical protein
MSDLVCQIVDANVSGNDSIVGATGLSPLHPN